jgi:serine phosphatase RsbU (regulator of sigma subunit)
MQDHGNLSIDDIIDAIPLFSALPEEELQLIGDNIKSRRYPAGMLILEENYLSNSLYYLLKGEVEIIKAFGTADERLLAVRKAGNFIGEMAMFNEESLHTASVRAFTDIQLLEVENTKFKALLKRNPRVAYEMGRMLSQRLDESENQTIQDLRQKNRELRKAYRELEAAQAELVEKKRLERELELARGIQRSILPHGLPQLPGHEFGAIMTPMSAVGGDFFDIIPLDQRHLGLAVGDVSDHGVPAALFMAMTVILLRAEARRSLSPSEALININRQIMETNEEGMFVTTLYGILDLVDHRFTYARAGHVLPILTDTRGNLIEINQGEGRIMGLYEELPLDEQSIDIPNGGTLFLYTDGINEAADPKGSLFGLERLHNLIAGLRFQPAQTMCNQILEQVCNHVGTTAQQDDITMLAMKRTQKLPPG